MSLFDTEFSEETVTLEQIAYQHEDWFVASATDLFKQIISHAAKNPNANFKRDKKLQELFHEIDKHVNKRFGLNIKHAGSDNMGYGVFSITSEAYSVIGDRSKEMLSKFEKEINHKSDKDVNDIVDIDNNIYSVMSKYLSNMKSLTTSLNVGSVNVDLKKARIENLPKDIVITLGVTTTWLLNNNLKAREMVAILIHEIGHAFTHIEYMYQSTANNTVLLESVISSIEDKLTPTESLQLINKEAFDSGVNLKNTTHLGKTLRLVNEAYTQERLLLEKRNRYAITDNEAQADIFTTRFGLGKEMVSGLSKNLNNSNDFLLFTTLLIPEILILAIHVLVFEMSIALSATLFILVFITNVFIIPVSILLYNDGSKGKWTYDKTNDRFNRIRNEIIKQLRTDTLTKQDQQKIINDLDEIQRWMDKYKHADFYQRVVDRLPWNIAETWNRDNEQLIENMLENNLHVAAAKLNNVKGK